MDVIHFTIEYSEEQDAQILSIYINGENLNELMRRYEIQFEPSIAGGYEGLNIEYLKNIEEHFFGKLNENDIYNYDGKTLVLGCNCGEPGCWPLIVRITEEDEVIIWSEFEQPFRDEESAGGYWDYTNFKSLEFNKQLYEEQLKAICKKFREVGNST